MLQGTLVPEHWDWAPPLALPAPAAGPGPLAAAPAPVTSLAAARLAAEGQQHPPAGLSSRLADRCPLLALRPALLTSPDPLPAPLLAVLTLPDPLPASLPALLALPDPLGRLEPGWRLRLNLWRGPSLLMRGCRLRPRDCLLCRQARRKESLKPANASSSASSSALRTLSSLAADGMSTGI